LKPEAAERNITGYLLWLISSALLFTGIALPMFSFHKFYIFDDTFSLLGGVFYLFREGEFLLFLILFGFTIALPVYKMVLSFLLISNRIKQESYKIKIVNRLAMIGKWSMTDVFVIAILAATVKLEMIASIEIHAGLFVFAAGVVASMLLVQRLLAGYELKPV